VKRSRCDCSPILREQKMEEAGNLPEPRPRTGTNGGILHRMLPSYPMDIVC
jgi:hypothetical protein